MLVLARGKDEDVIITHNGDKCIIKVTDIVNKNKVLLGIEASKEFAVERDDMVKGVKNGKG